MSLPVFFDRSETKFNSGCGWPAYYDHIPGSVERHVDNSYGMKRVEITCAQCGGHLGHVFEGEVSSTALEHFLLLSFSPVQYRLNELRMVLRMLSIAI